MKKILVLAISFIIIFSSSSFAKDIFIETRLNNLSFIENYSKANNINNSYSKQEQVITCFAEKPL